MNPDMQCTWWPDVWFGVSITHCCVAHDLGGSDAELAMCVASAAWWLLPVALVMWLGVKAGRPIYRRWSARRGE